MTTTQRISPTQAEKFGLLQAIVSALGGHTDRRAESSLSGYNPPAWLIFTVQPEGCSVFLDYCEDRKGDFLKVSGDWPRDKEGQVVTARDAIYGTPDPSIHVSAAKRPDVAAADIRRRFLPVYAPIYAAACAKVARHNVYASDVEGNNRKLATACGGTYEKRPYSSGLVLRGLPKGVRVKYVSDSRVDLELECTVAEACDILRQRAKVAA